MFAIGWIVREPGRRHQHLTRPPAGFIDGLVAVPSALCEISHVDAFRSSSEAEIEVAPVLLREREAVELRINPVQDTDIDLGKAMPLEQDGNRKQV